MLETITDFLRESVAHYGYLIVFVATLIENGAFVGIFIPGDSILILSGFFSRDTGIDLPLLILAGIAGAIVGDNISYYVGRHGGRGLLKRLEKKYPSFAKRLDQTDRYFKSHGGKTVLTGRFVAFIRTFVPFIAGVGRMPYGSFFIYNLIGASIQVAGLLILGYFFGAQYDRIEGYVGTVGAVLLGIIALTIFLVWRIRRQRRKGIEPRR